MRKLVGTGGVWLLAWAALLAADFWEDTDFATWSDKDVEKMLTDSPWARRATMLMGGLTAGADSTFQVGPGLIAAGRSLGGPAGAGPAPEPECGGEQFQRIRWVNVTVTWSSALPIKLALVRRLIRFDAPIPPEEQQALTRDEPFYTIILVGLPPPFAALEPTIDAVKAHTMLKRKNGEPIVPEHVQLLMSDADRSILIEYQFPKTDAITMEDTVVEFITILGADREIKKKFKLKDMIFGDELAL